MDDLSRALEDDLIIGTPGGRCKQQDDGPSADAHGADYTQTSRPLAEGLSKAKRTAVGFPRRLSLNVRIYSAAISSASPSERSISRARSASSYSFETCSCPFAAASSSSGERRTLR